MARPYRPVQKQSKYRNKRCEIDGLKFDSLAEARRYQELRLLEKAGEITDLDRQWSFMLTVCKPDWSDMQPKCAPRQVIGEYRCDFRYRDKSGKIVIEDVKGVMTPLSKWKIKHFEAQYGIPVQIVRMR